MAEGIRYEIKEELLLEGIQSLVFGNGQGLIDGEKNQKALKNIVESFWDRLSGLYRETITSVVGLSTLTLTREVVNSNIKIVGNIVTEEGPPGAIRNLVPNVIPRNFLGKKWFKLTKITIVHNKQPVSGGHNGYLELDETSTYNSGTLITDKTTLFIPGNRIGILRSYDVDDFNSLGGNGILDRIEDLEDNNYSTASPKDISVSGFSLGYITSDQSEIDYSTTNFTPSEGIDVSFVIEGYLI